MRTRTTTARRTAVLAAGLGLTMALAACGQNAAAPSTSGGASAASAAPAGAVKVGVILPETQSSARWEGFDKPLLTAAMQAEGLDADIQNAQGDEQKFSTLADGMISSGVKVLVIASISSESGAAVAAKAKAQGIPTIDYDRLSLGGTSDYYVSFDNTKVGDAAGPGSGRRAQGQAGRTGHRDRGRADGQQRDAVLRRRELRPEAPLRLGRAQARAEAGHPGLGQPGRRHHLRADPHRQRRPGGRRPRRERRPGRRGDHGADQVRAQRPGPGHRPGRHRGRPAGHPARRPVHDGLQADQAGGRRRRQADRARWRRATRPPPTRWPPAASTTRRATGRSSPCCSPRSRSPRTASRR